VTANGVNLSPTVFIFSPWLMKLSVYTDSLLYSIGDV
jgi:hypothetical protein